MKLGIRGKLSIVSLLLLVPVGLASGLYLERVLRRSLEDRIQAELTLLAESASNLIEIAQPELSIAAIDPIADRIGPSVNARITIVGEDGTVLGDSKLSPEEIARVENHGRRPEIVEAMQVKVGRARRFSTTIDTDMLYVAVPFDAGSHRGVVRAAKPLAEVGAAIRQLRLLLAIAAVLGLGAAVLMSFLASYFAGRTLADLVERARAIASAGKGRLPVRSTDELGRLAGSFNKVIADLDRTVAELAAERDHLETILDGMTEGVLALDERQQIVRANRAACELLGMASLSGPLLEAVRIPALAELVARAEDRASSELDLPGQKCVLARAAPLRASRGCVVVMHDVTEMRRLEGVRRDFVANVSHELRTPIAVIRANSETLLEGALEDPEHARAFLDGIHRNAERLSRLIADLLDLSRMEAGEHVVELAPIPLKPTVAHAIESVTGAARSKGIAVSMELDDEMTVEADARALEGVLLNLLDNAVKYTPRGGRVIVRGRYEDEAVRIEVEDDGPGIEPRHRGRIFERFYRVDPGRSRELGGTGLGLAIVKHLVGAMQGTVGFTPASPQGSIFWIRIRAAVTVPSREEGKTMRAR